MRRKIPYGVINWAEVVRECYFVDSTAYIRALEGVKTPVFLRPKRFGKSIWCSLLGYYYDVNFKDRFDELFGRTEIGGDPTPLANSFLVLTFDFSTIQVGSVREIERDFTDHVRTRAREFAARYKARADWREALDKPTAAGIIDALRSVVKQNDLPPIYVIVDEYDNFTNELVVSRRDAEYDAICGHDSAEPGRESFFKSFFKSFKAGLADGTVGRTYFTGVLPITLDDLSSGFNVGTVVNLQPNLLGMVGFTEAQVARYVDEIYADRGFDRANLPNVLADLKAFYDGYRFLPGAEPLYNATITNWYLFNLVGNGGVQPDLVIDANVRTDVGWIRRLAGGAANARARVEAYVERGEGEAASRGGLSAKFGRAKFFSEDFFPYALYYLGLLTFEDSFTLNIPNLTIRNMFVDYYDELSEFRNEDEARRHFGRAAKALALDGGTWTGKNMGNEMKGMKMKSVFGRVSRAVVLCAGIVAASGVPQALAVSSGGKPIRSTPAFVMRFDDNKPVSQWREVAEIFEEVGGRCSFAVNAAMLSETQWTALRDLSARGHEIMDHTAQHAVFKLLCTTAAAADKHRSADFFDHVERDGRLILCRPELDLACPGNVRVRAEMTNGVLRSTDPLFLRAQHFSRKFHVPSVGKTYGLGRNCGGKLFRKGPEQKCSDFWGRWTNDSFGPCEIIFLVDSAVQPSLDLLRAQAQESVSRFVAHGLPSPKTWIRPGGWEGGVDWKRMKAVYGDEFGYVVADSTLDTGLPAGSPWCRRSNFRFFDSDPDVEAVYGRVSAAIARGESFAYISHLWADDHAKFLARCRDFAARLKAGGIRLTTYSHIAD